MYRSTFSCLILCLVCAFTCCGSPGDKISVWSSEDADKYVRAREDPAVWDFDMLATDLLSDLSDSGDVPMKSSAFPVPKYDLLGGDTFHGLGFYNDFKPSGVDGKHYIYSAFMLRRNKLNTPYMPQDKSDEVFFMIVVLSDAAIDTTCYSHCVNSITSRNHPHYAGEGRIKTMGTDVDYIAFLTADRNEYALVNMRLFDLRQGRLVLIAPQKDGSLRSMQIDPGEIFSQSEIETVLDVVLCRAPVLAFFRASGAI